MCACGRARVRACTCERDFCTLARAFGSRSSVCVGALAIFFFSLLFFARMRDLIYARRAVWMHLPFCARVCVRV